MKEAKKAWCLLALRTEASSVMHKSTYADGDPDILREQDTLEFDNEEVEQFSKVIGKTLERVFLKDKVLLRSNFGCQATAEGNLAYNLRCSSNCAVN
jgi:hypothetical protein